MQLDSVTELLGIANYKVTHMTYSGDKRIELLLKRIEDKAIVCSGCGSVHCKEKEEKGTDLLCGRARSCSSAGGNPAPEGRPATG
jgi:hypothetical protein